jgi:hypothetical protein
MKLLTNKLEDYMAKLDLSGKAQFGNSNEQEARRVMPVPSDNIVSRALEENPNVN